MLDSHPQLTQISGEDLLYAWELVKANHDLPSIMDDIKDIDRIEECRQIKIQAINGLSKQVIL